MKNILILSNNCISDTESNGRLHGYNFLKYIKEGKIHNFYVRGNDDIKEVNYIKVSNKNAFLNKLSIGLKKICLDCHLGSDVNEEQSGRRSNKSKYVFFHLVRNWAFSNKKIIQQLSEYIKRNNIDLIQIWGTNIPFLYKYGYKLSQSNNIPLSIFTGEDYPLKTYNFINRWSILFPVFRRKLNNQAKRAYLKSKANIFATDELMEYYSKTYGCNNNYVIHFSSLLNSANFNEKENDGIFYGGNLYSGRCDSIIDVANSLSGKEMIHVYGNCSKKDIEKLSVVSNICYHGVIKYDELLTKMATAKLLLHVEGFSKGYIKDCRFAFSSKISDYLLTKKPVFFYGPLEISGIKYINNLDNRVVASSKLELSKLNDVLNQNIKINYNLIADLSADFVSNKMMSILEEVR